MDQNLARDIEKALIQQTRDLQYQVSTERKKRRQIQEELITAQESLEKCRRDYEKLARRHGMYDPFILCIRHLLEP
jgi:chromosome segregation ATPase